MTVADLFLELKANPSGHAFTVAPVSALTWGSTASAAPVYSSALTKGLLNLPFAQFRSL
jgi:hypothetical protein